MFVLLYRHALSLAERLELNELEMFDTRASIYENLAAVSMGLISIGLVLLSLAGLAGWVYLIMFPLTWAIKRQNALRRRDLESRLAPVPAGSDS